MTRRMEKMPSNPPKRESNEDLLKMLVDLVVGEIMFSAKYVNGISFEDTREALEKIQGYEFSAPFAPLGDLKNLAEKLHPIIREKIQKITDESKKAMTSASVGKRSQAREKTFFTDKEFEIKTSKARYASGPRPGLAAARQEMVEAGSRRRRLS